MEPSPDEGDCLRSLCKVTKMEIVELETATTPGITLSTNVSIGVDKPSEAIRKRNKKPVASQRRK